MKQNKITRSSPYVQYCTQYLRLCFKTELYQTQRFSRKELTKSTHVQQESALFKTKKLALVELMAEWGLDLVTKQSSDFNIFTIRD